MTLKVIGAGVGRTGTYSLKAALERLGFGPCYHMAEVMAHLPVALPLWQDAVRGEADWEKIFAGYESGVDWPIAGFAPRLNAAYPDAKFILTERSPESWAASFGETIYTLCGRRDEAPPHMREWLDMSIATIAGTGFPAGLDGDQLARAFVAHNDMVKATIPADRLLVFEVRQGWEPLCGFLGAPVPDEPFPRTNDRAEFWELVRAGSEQA